LLITLSLNTKIMTTVIKIILTQDDENFFRGPNKKKTCFIQTKTYLSHNFILIEEFS